MRFIFALTTFFSFLGKPFFASLVILLQIIEFIGFIALSVLKRGRLLSRSIFSFSSRFWHRLEMGERLLVQTAKKIFILELPRWLLKLTTRLGKLRKLPTLKLVKPLFFKKPRVFLPRLSWQLPKLPIFKRFTVVKVGQIALLIFIFFFSGISFYFWILKDLPSPEDLANHRPFLSTKIYDRKGRLLYKI